MFNNLIFRITIAILLGAAIGLEREWHHPGADEETTTKPAKPNLIGVRTFALTTLLGAITALFSNTQPLLFAIMTAGFLLMLISFYVISGIMSKDYGITSEIALFFSYLIGVLLIADLIPMQLTIAVAVVLLLILSQKTKIKNVVAGIKRSELDAFISYALVALVILPFLPNQGYLLGTIPGLADLATSLNLNLGAFAKLEIINPFSLWLVVALITGVDLAGYLLTRLVGQTKGWLLASMVGGFVSSTATTQTLAQQSKKEQNVNHLVVAAILANLTSFIQHLLLIGPVNSVLLVKMLPVVIGMVATLAIASIYFLKTQTKESQSTQLEQNNQEKTIFSLAPAIKFAVFFLLVKLVTKISLIVFGSSGFIFTSALASVTGIDAVSVNTAELAGKIITLPTAVATLLLVNVVNLASKTVYSFWQGKRDFAVKFAASMGATSLVGTIIYLFIK